MVRVRVSFRVQVRATVRARARGRARSSTRVTARVRLRVRVRRVRVRFRARASARATIRPTKQGEAWRREEDRVVLGRTWRSKAHLLRQELWPLGSHPSSSRPRCQPPGHVTQV